MRTSLFTLALLLTLGGTGWSASKASIQDGKQITLAYKLTVNGEVLEIADSKTPFTYLHGKNQIVPGLEKNLTGLHVGDQIASSDGHPIDGRLTWMAVEANLEIGRPLHLSGKTGRLILLPDKGLYNPYPRDDFLQDRGGTRRLILHLGG